MSVDKTKLVDGMAGLIKAILLAFCYWAGTTIVELKADSAGDDAKIENLSLAIIRIEGKVDKFDNKLDRALRRP